MPQAQVDGENSARPLNSANDILIAIGSNLTSSAGSPLETIRAAIKTLGEMGAEIRVISEFYQTPAFPEGSGPDFINAAVRIAAPWTPEHALAVCHRIEHDLDRVRQKRWGQRTIDLDLVAVGKTVLPDASTQTEWRELPLSAQIKHAPETLILPHPRLQDRAFVLVPLADVAPDWVHPLLGLSVAEMCAALDPALIKEVRAVE